jgi:glycosyltransferase involved in cell wall biosynthesis
MTTTIIIPSLNRPQYIKDTVENIRSVTEDFFLLYCVSDAASANELIALGVPFIYDCACIQVPCVCDTRYVTRMNKLGRLVETEFLFTGTDDSLFHPNWLEELLRVASKGFDVIVPDDMLNPSGTLALIRTSYIHDPGAVLDAPGLLFHPDYWHNGADVEQFATAIFHGRFARAMESKVQHLHASSTNRPMDDTYERFAYSAEGNQRDQALLERRKILWEGN